MLLEYYKLKFFFSVLRMTFSDTGSQYLILLFTCLFFRQDFQMASETFLVDYFLVSVIFKKICDLLLKVQNKIVNVIIMYSNFNNFSSSLW